MNSQNRKIGFVFLKAAIALISVLFIFRKVNSRSDFDSLLETISASANNQDKVVVFAAVMLLMVVNWLLESAKWKLLLKYINPSSWLRCIRSVMSGVTVSIFTPNRIGEFAGRVMHLDPGVRVKAAIASVIGSMNQLLITVIAGGIGLVFSLDLFINEKHFQILTVILIFLITSFAIYIYFRIPGLTRLANKFSSLRKLLLYTSVFEKYTTFTLVKLSMLSAIRYLVFSFQFILMLHWFDVNISWIDCLKGISVMYLVLAVVPSIALSELTIRGSAALYFFSDYSGNSSGILAATSMIWLINLVIPALAGALFAFYFKLNK